MEERDFLIPIPLGSFPVQVRFDAVLTNPTPWKSMPVFGLDWHPEAKPEELSRRITGETPLTFLQPQARLEKSHLERLHLDRYATDLLLATGLRPFGTIQPGDRPDFVVDTPTGPLRIDAIRYPIENRRAVDGLFRTVRRALLAEDPRRFENLAGLLVYAWVWDEKVDAFGKPHRSRDQALRNLIDELGAFRFDENLHRVPKSQPLSEQMQVSPAGSAHGDVFLATPLNGAFPSSAFFARLGFEIGFVFPTDHTSAGLWDELARTIREHDDAHNDELLVTVGGPDAEGFIFPSEQMLFDFMLRANPPSFDLKYVKRVVAHCWRTGDVIEIYPKPRNICFGHLQSLTPGFQAVGVHPFERRQKSSETG